PPPVDLAEEKRNGDFVRGLIRSGRVATCHDLSDGGLAIAVAEMCMASDRGARIDAGDGAGHALLFGEDQARYVVAVAADMAGPIEAEAGEAGVPVRRLGVAGGSRLVIDGRLDLSVAALTIAHESWFPSYMSGEIIEPAAAA
ncbi:MAG TPA: AIR synthase-related protein, partial [Aurantimonas sp.]